MTKLIAKVQGHNSDTNTNINDNIVFELESINPVKITANFNETTIKEVDSYNCSFTDGESQEDLDTLREIAFDFLQAEYGKYAHFIQLME